MRERDSTSTLFLIHNCYIVSVVISISSKAIYHHSENSNKITFEFSHILILFPFSSYYPIFLSLRSFVRCCCVLCEIFILFHSHVQSKYSHSIRCCILFLYCSFFIWHESCTCKINFRTKKNGNIPGCRAWFIQQQCNNNRSAIRAININRTQSSLHRKWWTTIHRKWAWINPIILDQMRCLINRWTTRTH